jgi:hypothetical protein
MNEHYGFVCWEGVAGSREEPEIRWRPWKNEGPQGKDAYSVVIQSLGGHSLTWAGLCLGDSGSLVCYLHVFILLCCPFTESENLALFQDRLHEIDPRPKHFSVI